MADINYNKKNEAAAEQTDAIAEQVEVVGINFREAGKIYYFAPGKLECKLGQRVGLIHEL